MPEINFFFFFSVPQNKNILFFKMQKINFFVILYTIDEHLQYKWHICKLMKFGNVKPITYRICNALAALKKMRAPTTCVRVAACALYIGAQRDRS